MLHDGPIGGLGTNYFPGVVELSCVPKLNLAWRIKHGADIWIPPGEVTLLPRRPDGDVRPDHVSKRFKRLAAQGGVPVIKLHDGGRHTGNSLMRDAGVDQELRMRAIGHAGREINDRYTHTLIEAHLAAAEQTAALVRQAGGES